MDGVLFRLESDLRSRRPDYLASLSPGEDVLPDAPPELRALLSWRNGHLDPDEAEPLFGKYQLMSADEIEEDRGMFNEMLEGDEWDNPDWWNYGYWPFATDGSSDYLLIDTEGHLGGKPGQIIDWDHASPMRQILCDTLERFLDSVATPDPNGLDPIKSLFARNPGFPVFKNV